jgi:hypothetical protein
LTSGGKVLVKEVDDDAREAIDDDVDSTVVVDNGETCPVVADAVVTEDDSAPFIDVSDWRFVVADGCTVIVLSLG